MRILIGKSARLTCCALTNRSLQVAFWCAGGTIPIAINNVVREPIDGSDCKHATEDQKHYQDDYSAPC